MMSRTELTLDLPAQVVELLGTTPGDAARTAKQAILLHLLREGRISQGRVAEWLGITRHDVLDLMAEYEIPSGPRTPEELDRELETIEQYVRKQHG